MNHDMDSINAVVDECRSGACKVKRYLLLQFVLRPFVGVVGNSCQRLVFFIERTKKELGLAMSQLQQTSIV